MHLVLATADGRHGFWGMGIVGGVPPRPLFLRLGVPMHLVLATADGRHGFWGMGIVGGVPPRPLFSRLSASMCSVLWILGGPLHGMSWTECDVALSPLGPRWSCMPVLSI
jgi:hypothetical protein